MGLPSRKVQLSTTPDDTVTRRDAPELSKGYNDIDVLHDVIEELKRNLSSLQEKNFQLNKSNHELRSMYTNLKNTSGDVIYPISNKDIKDPATPNRGKNRRLYSNLSKGRCHCTNTM